MGIFDKIRSGYHRFANAVHKTWRGGERIFHRFEPIGKIAWRGVKAGAEAAASVSPKARGILSGMGAMEKVYHDVGRMVHSGKKIHKQYQGHRKRIGRSLEELRKNPTSIQHMRRAFQEGREGFHAGRRMFGAGHKFLGGARMQYMNKDLLRKKYGLGAKRYRMTKF